MTMESPLRFFGKHVATKWGREEVPVGQARAVGELSAHDDLVGEGDLEGILGEEPCGDDGQGFEGDEGGERGDWDIEELWEEVARRRRTAQRRWSVCEIEECPGGRAGRGRGGMMEREEFRGDTWGVEGYLCNVDSRHALAVLGARACKVEEYDNEGKDCTGDAK